LISNESGDAPWFHPYLNIRSFLHKILHYLCLDNFRGFKILICPFHFQRKQQRRADVAAAEAGAVHRAEAAALDGRPGIDFMNPLFPAENFSDIFFIFPPSFETGARIGVPCGS
jgi:hypothetical protein